MGREAVGDRVAVGEPRHEPAVEHRNVRVADVAQHPPQASGDRASAIVVGDDRVAVPDAEGAHPLGERRAIRQRVPAGARECRQVPLEIDVDRPGDVGLGVFAAAAVPIAEVPAAVGDPQGGVVESRGELAGGHEAHRATRLPGAAACSHGRASTCQARMSPTIGTPMSVCTSRWL